MIRAVWFCVLVCACDSKPAAPRDPWATPASAPAKPRGGDPWAAGADPAAAAAPAPPAAAEQPPPDPSAATGLPEGSWDCNLIGTTWMNGQRFTQTSQLNGFTLHGGEYSSEREGSGTVEVDGPYATFHGGGFDNWRGAFNSHQDGSRYLVFGGPTHRDAQPDHGSTVGDVECEPAH